MAERIRSFWCAFEQFAPALSQAQSADDAAYDHLLHELQEIHPDLYLEFSLGPPRELIVTAEGNRELFQLAHTVVAAAPGVDGWTVRALKPTLGFPRSVRWNNVTVRVEAVRFDPLEVQHSDELGIRLFVPDLREEDFEDAHNAILRAIDHGLGEERFANAIQFTEIETMSSHANPDQLVSLLELDAFIRGREKKRHT